jgi:soluble lytic murein transglycosylase-like protein
VKYDAEVSRAIAHWAPVYGVSLSPALVHAVIEAESSHGLALESSEPGGRRSYGPMMVLDTTARSEFNVSNPRTLRNPALGIWYGVAYLAQMLRKFPGDVARAVSAYNTGPARAKLSRAGKFPNQPYVTKVFELLRRYQGAAVVAAPAALLVLGGLLLLRRLRAA